MTENRRGRPRYAIGYTRVSTRRQAEEGNGLEAQAESLRNYAREHGYTLKGIREDTTSGNDRRALMDREDFRDAVKEAKRLKAVIIVTRLDRLSRNSEKFWQFLRQEKLRIVSLVPDETEDVAAQRRAVTRGQQVRERIARGTVEVLARRKQKGVVLG
ncbi:MAG TPA: recombinase family protein [Albidovulum sp.]|uniref:recombinase family protein n=1 Tax=Albidovulum sp. TaxID=1872424 RepID=UPI002BE9CA54|nr:recombinase family protein [Albidovulum sp.]